MKTRFKRECSIHSSLFNIAKVFAHDIATNFGGFHDARERNSRFLTHNFLTPGEEIWRAGPGGLTLLEDV